VEHGDYTLGMPRQAVGTLSHGSVQLVTAVGSPKRLRVDQGH
jgi:hypothetical protein